MSKLPALKLSYFLLVTFKNFFARSTTRCSRFFGSEEALWPQPFQSVAIVYVLVQVCCHLLGLLANKELFPALNRWCLCLCMKSTKLAGVSIAGLLRPTCLYMYVYPFPLPFSTVLWLFKVQSMCKRNTREAVKKEASCMQSVMV